MLWAIPTVLNMFSIRGALSSTKSVSFFSINAQTAATFPLLLTRTYDFFCAVTITTALYYVAKHNYNLLLKNLLLTAKKRQNNCSEIAN